MKKALLMLLVALCSCSVMLGVPAMRGFVNVAQSDGTTLSVQTAGNWHEQIISPALCA